MNIEKINQYVKERDEALLKDDIPAFEEFLKRNTENGIISDKIYNHFINADEIIKKGTMYKMICNIPSMPKELVKKAKKWLKKQDMTELYFKKD